MYPFAKRLFDISLSIFGLIVFSAIFIIFAFFIKVDSAGPVFYRGVRAGKGGKSFKVLKFRTMVVNAEKKGGPSTADDDPRITKIGKFLRKYKLDELPQLINVLKGEMSLVGPRPEVFSEVEKYTPEEYALLSVPPGMTDWASIKFKNEGEILKGAADPHKAYLEKIRPEKMRLGLEYIHKRSFLIDLRILFETVTKILKIRT